MASTNYSLISLKTCSTRWKPCLALGTSQLLSASEIGALGVKTTTATLLSQLVPNQCSKYLLLHLQMSVVLIPHQENFSLQQMEMITENHKHLNAELCTLVNIDTSTTLAPKA